MHNKNLTQFINKNGGHNKNQFKAFIPQRMQRSKRKSELLQDDLKEQLGGRPASPRAALVGSGVDGRQSAPLIDSHGQNVNSSSSLNKDILTELEKSLEDSSKNRKKAVKDDRAIEEAEDKRERLQTKGGKRRNSQKLA